MKKLIVSAVGILVFSIIGFKAIEAIKENSSYIAVIGLSDRIIKSDKALLKIGIEHRADVISSISEKRELNKKLIKDWLISNKIESSEISEVAPYIASPYNYKENNEPKYRIVDYVIVTTNKVDLVNDIKTKIYKLIETNPGLMIDCVEPNFSYSDMSNLRIEMLEEAVKDTELRAHKIAESSKKQISGLRSVATGKFAVYPDDSRFTDDYSWGEERSLNKRVRIVVQGTYNIK